MAKTLLTELKVGVRTLLNAQWRTLAGAAFVCLAMVSIAYDEALAPHFDRWTQVVGDLARKLPIAGA